MEYTRARGTKEMAADKQPNNGTLSRTVTTKSDRQEAKELNS
jgi:hypothetical protein